MNPTTLRCFFRWVGAAILVSVCIRDGWSTRVIATVVGLASIAATWWGLHQTQYPFRQVLVHRLAFAAGFVGLVWFNLPLTAVFWMCRPSFERAARRLVETGGIRTPTWIGPFRIRFAGVRDGTPYFGTSKDEGEIDGFVRHPEGAGFNIWSCEKLDADWAFIMED